MNAKGRGRSILVNAGQTLRMCKRIQLKGNLANEYFGTFATYEMLARLGCAE